MSYPSDRLYRKQGQGDQDVIVPSGVNVQVESGASLDIESGATLEIAGTAITATAAEINAIAGGGLSAAELGVLDGVTGGTVTASKAVVVDASKDIAAFGDVGAVNLDAGSSGVAGSVDIFPTTASKGKIAISAADSAGDTTTSIVNASQGGARTYTIPDAGASGTFALNLANEGHVKTAGVSFTEDGSGTSYIGTVEIPAGAVLHDICFVTTVLWDGTSASLIIGDDDDDNGWLQATDLKATDLLVGEVYSMMGSGVADTDDSGWLGKTGDYLVASTGRKGRTAAGDSGLYYGAASEVIFKVTPGAADGSAGRSFGWVSYSVPTFVASTNT